MGCWGMGLKQSDEFMDFYDELIIRYNFSFDEIKQNPSNREKIVLKIGNDIIAEQQSERFYIEDPSLMIELYFAVALAEFDCGVKDRQVIKKVIEIIDADEDINRLTELLASPKSVQKRREVLAQFRQKLLSEPVKFKKPKRMIIKKAQFRKGDVFVFKTNKENVYGGAVVLEAKEEYESATNYIAVADFVEKPTVEQILNANASSLLWYFKMKTYKFMEDWVEYEIIGTVEVSQTYPPKGCSAYSFGDWNTLKSCGTFRSNGMMSILLGDRFPKTTNQTAIRNLL
ncbi:MAG: hypothetical protein LBT20_05645 [Clostridiales bacterium]|jgi:hypothetical protein|nr:hypothetical protein [Clostridiales bacterium]